MAKTKDRKAGDPCPTCDGEMVLDETQAPDVLIDRKKRNAASPVVAERFAERVREKAAEFGVIHRCADCGYRERFPSKGKAA